MLKKKKWLSRALSCALAVTLTAGTAVMTPVADIVGTNITANAAYEGYTAWTGTGTDADGNSATVTCYWKVDNGTLYVAGTAPNTGNQVGIPWYKDSNIRSSITKVYVEEGTKTSADAGYLFFSLPNAASMDLSNLDTSAATNMKSMFYNCKKLTTLNLSSWHTSKVTNMTNLFSDCTALTSLNLNGWNTSSVTSMESMFNTCESLTSLDLSGLDTSSVTNMATLFTRCSKLTSLNLNSWKTSSVTSMRAMFQLCKALISLDVSGWNISSVTDMSLMFGSCTALASLDLSGWDTQNVTTMSMMFNNCTALATIYVGNGWNTDKITSNNSYSMFSKCTSLVGGKGTTYDSSKIDKTYAHIDGGTSNPGYFTQGVVKPKTYTVTWKNYDGTTLETDQNVEEGTTPSYDGATPTKASTAQYSYTFSGWDKEITAVTGDVTYTAQFTETTNTYTVTWIDGDGNTLKTDTVAYGTTPTYDGATPTKESNAQYTYTFSGWDKAIAAVTGDVTYTAQFSDTVNEYTVTWIDGDGNTLKTDTVAYGDTPEYNGETPTKTATAQYSYTFSGWDKEITAVTGDVTYTAQFTETTNTYTVNWKNEDGTPLETDEDVPYGTPSSYDGETLTKDGCIFAGWKNENGDFYKPEDLPAVAGDVTYTAVFDKEITVGTVFYPGETFNTNGNKYICYNFPYNYSYDYDCRNTIPEPQYYINSSGNGCWYFEDLMGSWDSLYFDNDFYDDTVPLLGFKCVSGDGLSNETAYKFEPVYQGIESSDMNFSAVTENLVSIQDENGNEVSLTDGNAVIKNGYVITSRKPLIMPQVYCTLQEDQDGNFVYTVKNMVETPVTVSCDTSAFKGKIYSHLNTEFSVSGYNGKSEDKTNKKVYGNQSVSFDFSRGTTISATTYSYYAPVDEFFDIYDSNGTKINNLFDFVVGKDYYNGNLYTYTLKQNLESDIHVFDAGHQFTVTLPDGVEIENKDVILSQDGNVYTIRPLATVTLMSDSLINIYDNDKNELLTADIDYSAVKDHKFVYEVDVTNPLSAEISTASIITTQEEFKNVKVGDYIIPSETLSLNAEGYQWYDRDDYLSDSGKYYTGSGSYIGSTAITIGTDLAIYANSNVVGFPANPDLCTQMYQTYDIDTYKGNAWRVDYIGSQYGYSKAIGFTGVCYTEPAEYVFTWSDDNRTATVTFNGGEPVEAVVERKADNENNQWIYTATAEYNGVPYIETKAVNGYTVEWKNDNGTVLETDTNTEPFTTPVYDGDTPVKQTDNDYVYTFKGWTSDGGETVYTANDTFPAVSENVTYTAVFDEFVIIHEDDVFVNSTDSEPEITVTDCHTGAVLTENTDYTITVNDDSTVTITGKGSYTGEVQKNYIVLTREMVSSVANRRKAGINAKASLSGEWYLPKNATNIKAGIARISTDDTNVTNYDVYKKGVKKSCTLKTTSGKYSFSLLMNSTHANQNLYAVTYVTYEIDGKKLTSISKVFASYSNPVA